ncbi:hypothetical protein PV08_11711 [Exophiala spinifera]|uniref:Uncharacterized protein n=1 Tax=Exophiala spinifera TaxID=91928 RepID=A0A0D2ATY2_9EURO|nr:uncharacterized protein PV08_11711 [Exophiala spinifera]KIW09935.1 hypothetical protein PV08_11711 [Exophiala spinifera]
MTELVCEPEVDDDPDEAEVADVDSVDVLMAEDVPELDTVAVVVLRADEVEIAELAVLILDDEATEVVPEADETVADVDDGPPEEDEEDRVGTCSGINEGRHEVPCAVQAETTCSSQLSQSTDKEPSVEASR